MSVPLGPATDSVWPRLVSSRRIVFSLVNPYSSSLPKYLYQSLLSLVPGTDILLALQQKFVSSSRLYVALLRVQPIC